MVMTVDALNAFTEAAQDDMETMESIADFEHLLSPRDMQIKPTGMEMNRLSRPVTIYHRGTGEPRVMPFIYALSALRKRFRQRDAMAGQLVFSARPTKPWILGTVPCALHPSRPERGGYDRLGLPTCLSAHFPSEFEVQRHMAFDHSTALETVTRIKEERRRVEQERIQLDTLRTQQALLERLAMSQTRTAPDEQAQAPRKRTQRKR